MTPLASNSHYLLTTAGEVYSTHRNSTKLLACKFNTDGYKQLAAYDQGKVQYLLVHRCVYETFVGPIPDGLTIDHIDGDKTNNNLSNLRLVTQQHNIFNKAPGKGWSVNRSGKYVARLVTGRKQAYLGSYDTAAEAHAVYVAAKTLHHVPVAL